MLRVFLTRQIPPAVMNELGKICELRVNPEDRAMSQSEIIEAAQDCQILFCMLGDKIDKKLISSLPKLQGIVNYAVGYNNIDLEYAAQRKIAVTNTPGVLTETTADLAWALIFGVARRVVEADKFTRAGKFHGWAPELILGSDIYGKTLGIVGAGRIGSAVAKRASGFGMKILYTSRSSVLDLENSQKVKLPELLQKSDFVSLHLPLNSETRHLIGAAELKMMKSSAFLINTARGPVVDEAELVKALEEKSIAGAGLDVYEQEPELHPGLPKLANVILLPHLGSGTLETRINMGMICLENIKAIMAGEEPPQKVN